jgi:hypothetical protein
MLTVQVNYQGVQETIRHNLAVEKETTRHNQIDETIGFGNLEELQRHNKATESIQRQQIGLGYANLAYNYASLSETRRANLERESQGRRSLMIQAGGLQETIRTHKANEALAAFSNVTARMNAETNRKQFEVQSAQGWQSLANQQYANETNRMNARTNEVNARTNQFNARINKQNAETNWYNAKTGRYNFYSNVVNDYVSAAQKSFQSAIDSVKVLAK